ncbi:MAG: hypothetical protein ABIP39_06420 [Polyangiaceae bacterium]
MRRMVRESLSEPAAAASRRRAPTRVRVFRKPLELDELPTALEQLLTTGDTA